MSQEPLPKQDFLDYISSKIRVSTRNYFLNPYPTHSPTLTPSSFQMHSKTYSKSLTSLHRRSQVQIYERLKLPELCPSFMLFITASLKNILPDIEIIKFKQTCLTIISTLDTPNEGHFGLVKIFCYEEKYKEAVHHLKHLMKSDPNDSSYLTWLIILKFKQVKNTKDALKVKNLALSNK